MADKFELKQDMEAATALLRMMAEGSPRPQKKSFSGQNSLFEEKVQVSSLENLEFSGIYSLNHLSQYLKSLRESAETHPTQGFYTFVLKNPKRRLCLGYDPRLQKIWVLENPMQSKDVTQYDLSNEEDDINIAKLIMAYMSEKKPQEVQRNDQLSFSSNIYFMTESTKDKKEKKKFLEIWQQSNAMQELHAIDPQWLVQPDILKNNWFQMMLAEHHLSSLKKVLNDESCLAVLNQFSSSQALLTHLEYALVNAFLNENTEIIQILANYNLNWERIFQGIIQTHTTDLVKIERNLLKIQRWIEIEFKEESRKKSEIIQINQKMIRDWKASIDRRLEPLHLSYDEVKWFPPEILTVLLLDWHDSYNEFLDLYSIVPLIISEKFSNYLPLIFDKILANPGEGVFFVRSATDVNALIMEMTKQITERFTKEYPGKITQKDAQEYAKKVTEHFIKLLFEFLIAHPRKFQKYVPDMKALNKITENAPFEAEKRIKTWAIQNPDESGLRITSLKNIANVGALIKEIKKFDFLIELYLNALMSNFEELSRILPDKKAQNDFVSAFPEWKEDFQAFYKKYYQRRVKKESSVILNYNISRHGTILRFMEILGYPPVRGGGCWGISHKKLEAGLLGKLADVDLNGRISLEAQLDVLDRRLVLIAQLYRQYLEPFEEEIDHLYQYAPKLVFENFLEEKRNFFFQELQKSIGTSAEEIKSDKVSPLYHDLMTDIYSFFDNIALIQKGKDLSYLYHKKSFKHYKQDYEDSIKLSASKALIDKGGVVQIDSFVSIYDLDRLKDYFQSLRESLHASPISSVVMFELNNKNHGITFGYDPQKKHWILGDPNYLYEGELPIGSLDAYNDEMMATIIMRYLTYKSDDQITKQDKIIFRTRGFMTGVDYTKETGIALSPQEIYHKKDIKPPVFIQKWHASKLMKPIDHVMPEDTLKYDVLGASIFYRSISKSEVDNIQKLLDDPRILNFLKTSMRDERRELDLGFESAIFWCQTEIMALLFAKGADLDLALKNIPNYSLKNIAKIDQALLNLYQFYADNLKNQHEGFHYPNLEKIRNMLEKYREDTGVKLKKWNLSYGVAYQLPEEVAEILLTERLESNFDADDMERFTVLRTVMNDHPEWVDPIIKRIFSEPGNRVYYLPDTTGFLEILKYYTQYTSLFLDCLLNHPDKLIILIPNLKILKELTQKLESPKMADFVEKILLHPEKYKIRSPDVHLISNFSALVDNVKNFPLLAKYLLQDLLKQDEDFRRLITDEDCIELLSVALPFSDTENAEFEEKLRNKFLNKEVKQEEKAIERRPVPPGPRFQLFQQRPPRISVSYPKKPNDSVDSFRIAVLNLFKQEVSKEMKMEQEKKSDESIENIRTYAFNLSSQYVTKKSEAEIIKKTCIQYADQIVRSFSSDQITYAQFNEIITALGSKLRKLPHTGYVSRFVSLVDDRENKASLALHAFLNSVSNEKHRMKWNLRNHVIGSLNAFNNKTGSTIIIPARYGAFDPLALKQAIQAIPDTEKNQAEKLKVMEAFTYLENFLEGTDPQPLKQKLEQKR